MTERRILHIEISTAQTVRDAFAQTWERLERGEQVQPIEAIGFESLSEMLCVLTPRRWEIIQSIKHRGPLPIGDLGDPGTPYQGVGPGDIEALTNLGILEIDDRQRVFVPWDEIDLRVPLAT